MSLIGMNSEEIGYSGPGEFMGDDGRILYGIGYPGDMQHPIPCGWTHRSQSGSMILNGKVFAVWDGKHWMVSSEDIK